MVSNFTIKKVVHWFAFFPPTSISRALGPVSTHTCQYHQSQSQAFQRVQSYLSLCFKVKLP